MDVERKISVCKKWPFHSILFCGAGFSADCLGFDDVEEIGVGAHLLKFFNRRLSEEGKDSGFKDLRNAADEFYEAFGDHGAMKALQARYDIQNVTADMVDIVRYPWSRIYTTNYDNSIEVCLSRAKKRSQHANNIDEYRSFQSERNLVYLHGRAHSWDVNNFRKSCILGMDSYHSLSFLEDWLDLFRLDLEKAELIVFVGFNANDFHLNEVLRNIVGVKEKIFFVNKTSAAPDIDVKRTQSKFGNPVYLGRQGLSELVRQELSHSAPTVPSLSSFQRFVRSDPANDVPSTSAIENLFVFGILDANQLYRDVDYGLSDYHVNRESYSEIVESINHKANIILISGDICEGKTLAVASIMRRLDVFRPVFSLKLPYDDLLDEVASIFTAFPSAVLVVENCFDLSRERLLSLARQAAGTSATVIFTTRSIAAEARTHDLMGLREMVGFREFKMPPLNEVEVVAIAKLSDQIAAWNEFRGFSENDKVQFLKQTCRSSLPSFLLRLLKSDYVRDRYREEYNKIEGLSIVEKNALICALYISHIGDDARVSFLSDIFKFDVGAMLMRSEGVGVGLRIARLKGNRVETVPSIGATSLLRDVISDSLIVDVVYEVLRRLSETVHKDDFRRHVFSQMMRYSILRPVIDDDKWIARFFDKISKIEYIRRQVLFWLQWSIALREQGKYVDAEKMLDQGYSEAEAYEKRSGRVFDRRQLNDVTAKLLVARSFEASHEASRVYRDLTSAVEIVGRLIKAEDLTHHPFETLEGCVELYQQRSVVIAKDLRKILRTSLLSVVNLAESRIGMVSSGYQSSKASESLSRIRAISLP